MRRVIYEHNQSKRPSHTPRAFLEPTSSLIVACAAGYYWRGQKPASPLSFPCWHHQGGLPYSRGVQLWSLRSWFACIFSFQTSKPQMRFISSSSAWLEWNLWGKHRTPLCFTVACTRLMSVIVVNILRTRLNSQFQCGNCRSTSPIMCVLAGYKDLHALYCALRAACAVHGAEY